MAQVRINGEKIRKTFPTKAEAIAWEVDQRKTLPVLQPLQRIVTISLADWASRYLDFCKD